MEFTRFMNEICTLGIYEHFSFKVFRRYDLVRRMLLK